MGRGRKTGQRGWGRGGSRTDASTRMGERPERSREANEPQEAEVSGETVLPWDGFRSPPGQAWPPCRWLKREIQSGKTWLPSTGEFSMCSPPKGTNNQDDLRESFPRDSIFSFSLQEVPSDLGTTPFYIRIRLLLFLHVI